MKLPWPSPVSPATWSPRCAAPAATTRDRDPALDTATGLPLSRLGVTAGHLLLGGTLLGKAGHAVTQADDQPGWRALPDEAGIAAGLDELRVNRRTKRFTVTWSAVTPLSEQFPRVAAGQAVAQVPADRD